MRNKPPSPILSRKTGEVVVNGYASTRSRPRPLNEELRGVWEPPAPPKVESSLKSFLRKVQDDLPLQNLKKFRVPHGIPRMFPGNLFPGEPRRDSAYGGNELKPVVVFDHIKRNDRGKGPLLCSKCNGSCLKKPLLQCDYCPVYYHLDCVDPPLMEPPKTLWMCPQHPIKMYEKKMLHNSRRSTRVKLWRNEISLPVKQADVMIEFLRTVQRPKGPNSSSAPPPEGGNVSRGGLVPIHPGLAEAYEGFMDDVASFSSGVEGGAALMYEEPPRSAIPVPKPTYEEEELFLEAVVKFQQESLDYLRELRKAKTSENSTDAQQNNKQSDMRPERPRASSPKIPESSSHLTTGDPGPRPVDDGKIPPVVAKSEVVEDAEESLLNTSMHSIIDLASSAGESDSEEPLSSPEPFPPPSPEPVSSPEPIAPPCTEGALRSEIGSADDVQGVEDSDFNLAVNLPEHLPKSEVVNLQGKEDSELLNEMKGPIATEMEALADLKIPFPDVTQEAETSSQESQRADAIPTLRIVGDKIVVGFGSENDRNSASVGAWSNPSKLVCHSREEFENFGKTVLSTFQIASQEIANIPWGALNEIYVSLTEGEQTVIKFEGEGAPAPVIALENLLHRDDSEVVQLNLPLMPMVPPSHQLEQLLSTPVNASEDAVEVLFEKLSPEVRDKLLKKYLSSLIFTNVEPPRKRRQVKKPNLSEILEKRPEFLMGKDPLALIAPITSKGALDGDPIPIFDYSFSIGTSPHCLLPLRKFGKCCRVSSYHAEILFIKEESRFECLNYSQFGTFVDDQFYCFISFDDSSANVGPGTCRCTEAPTSSRRKPNHPPVGWDETAASLHNGSVLRFGCLHFVFVLSGNASLSRTGTGTKTAVDLEDEATAAAAASTAAASSMEQETGSRAIKRDRPEEEEENEMDVEPGSDGDGSEDGMEEDGDGSEAKFSPRKTRSMIQMRLSSSRQ